MLHNLDKNRARGKIIIKKKYINIINKQKLSYNCYVVSMNNETSTPFRQCFTVAMLCPWIMKHKLYLDINSQKIYHVSVTNNMYTFFSQPNPVITSDIFWMAEIQYLSFIHLEEIQCQSQINIQSSNNWQSFWFNNKYFIYKVCTICVCGCAHLSA